MVNNIHSKPHYELLDGLRGIAAIAVVIFHCGEIIIPDFTKLMIAHGFLAVDFFFCLSGFVVAYAYDSRMPALGVKKFLINRLIRLQPLVVLGTLLGLAGLFLDPFASSDPLQEFGWGKIIMATMCSLLLLPAPILGRFGNVFPLNAPAWSLSMEYFINLLYAFVLVRISKKMLLVFLAASLLFISMVAYLHGGVIGGWGAASYGDGYARVLFSFLAGVAVFRFRLTIQNKIGFLLYALALAGVFLFPHTENDWWVELAFVVFVFPLLIALGAGTQVTGWVRQLCVALGAISYPLYMTHYWMMWFLISYSATKPGLQNIYLFAAGIVIGALALAWAVLKFYDEPIRKWLKNKFLGINK
ncbi:acyltransferase family protein [Niabella insulamsoli]|uniref:acyltransferase family protein n=1 Tax=Niabella insulamsoli TaxID=3144874 RepID=UPI0031FC2B63